MVKIIMIASFYCRKKKSRWHPIFHLCSYFK